MKKQILLVNLGTPQSPGYLDMFRYLAEFLGDKRVVDLSRLLWLPLLYLIILPFRAYKSGHTYAQIWDKKKGSPLRFHTEALAKKMGATYAMRYGQPSIATTLTRLKNQGAKTITVLPLYPQYAGATTGTAKDVIATWKTQNPRPKVSITPPYYAHPAYISALAKSIVAAKTKNVLVSFHGIPVRYVKNGDPYQTHCEATFKALQKALPKHKLILTYQSRFGREEWLGPATDDTLAKLPQQGIKSIAVIAPGFAVDCVETLEELGLRGRETFLANGGKSFTLISCLNASGAQVLAKLL